jgi:hypothetical protein
MQYCFCLEEGRAFDMWVLNILAVKAEQLINKRKLINDFRCAQKKDRNEELGNSEIKMEAQ